MRARAGLPLWYLVVLALAAVPVTAQAGPWLPAPGEHYAQFEAGRTFADTYLDADGGRQDLAAHSERRAIDSYIELGWKRKLSFVLAAPIVSQTHRVGTISETATGLGDIHVGFRYGLWTGPRALAIQLDVREPLGYDTRRAAKLGDGLQDWGLDAHYGSPITRRGFIQVSAGGAHRFLEKAFSSQPDSMVKQKSSFTQKDTLVRNADYIALHHQEQARFGADVGWWVGRAFLVTGHYRGVITVANGDASPDVAMHVVGPELRYRVDDRLDLIAGSNHIASGRSALHDDQYYVGVAYRQTKLNRLQGFLGNLSAP